MILFVFWGLYIAVIHDQSTEAENFEKFLTAKLSTILHSPDISYLGCLSVVYGDFQLFLGHIVMRFFANFYFGLGMILTMKLY